MVAEQVQGERAYAVQACEPRETFRRRSAERCRSARKPSRLVLVCAKEEELVFEYWSAEIAAHPVEVVAGPAVGLRARRYIGHNPAGGIMVVLLLLLLAADTATGIMMTTDAFWGIEWVRHAHSLAVDLTLLLVAGHLAGVALASYEHRENLVKAMVTGLKRVEDSKQGRST